MIRTVFMETKKNIPFDTHSSLVSLQKSHGVNLGFHHFDKCGAINMLESMSAHMHALLMKHIVSKNLPLSIVIDRSSDSSENKYLIIFFPNFGE